MTSNCTVLVSVLLLSIPVCAQVPHAADVQAINAATAAWDQAWNAGNADALASLYTRDAIAMGPNDPALVGREAIQASSKKYFDEVNEENHSLVEDIRVSGDLAVARGTQTTKTSPKAGGDSVEDKAKWIAVFQRQPDGAWKVLWEIYNTDLPLDSRRQERRSVPGAV